MLVLRKNRRERRRGDLLPLQNEVKWFEISAL